MASKIKVDQIEGQSGTTVTLPSGQTLDLSSGSVTLPNNAVDLASAKVTGTLGSSNLPTIPVSKGGTGITSLGSAGQALKVNSGASALEFGTISSDYVKLATHTVSSAVSAVSIDGNGSWIDNTTYGGYIFYMRNISTSNDSNNSVLTMRFNFAGSAHTGSDYYDFSIYASGSTSSTTGDASKTWAGNTMGLGYNNMDSEESRSGYGFVEFLNTGGDANGSSGNYFPNMTCNFFSHHSNSSSLYNYQGMGYCANNNPISGLTILPTGGNIDLGTITVYGRKK